MQEYEKENNIKKWSLEEFKKAFETIDSKLHRESDWTLDGKNLHYTVRKCSLASNGNDPNKCICHTIRETFKGALVTLSEIKRCLMFTNYYLKAIIFVRW